MNKKVWIAVVAVLLLGGISWAFWPSGDAQVQKVVALQEKIFSEGAKDMPREEREKAWQELRTEADKLTDDERMKMMRDNPPPFVRDMQKNMVAFFDLPEAERKKELDKQIDEWEKRRKEREKSRAERDKSGGGPPGAGGPGGGPPGGGGPGGGFGGGRGNWNDPGKQAQMRKAMLDNTTPQQRAMFSEYFSEMAKRRQERGLPPMPGPPR